MSTPFKLDHEALARCALELREALKNSEHREIPYFKKIIDYELDHLEPILDLCIAKELEEPFDLLAYVSPRIFGDVIDFPEFVKPYYELANLLRGGIGALEIDETEYRRRLPRQMRENPRPSKVKLNRWGF
jgi:hypothetical protein